MYSRTRKHSRKMHNKKHNTKHNTKYNKIKKSKKSRSTRRRTQRNQSQRGGFNNCSLATVQEPGFNIPAIGDVPGFSLSQSKGVINRPNCKTDSYQAMIPA
jgi:phosphatidylserine/phosphatidylglycerophosphate/cardiolipin synthase-like enzyme